MLIFNFDFDIIKNTFFYFEQLVVERCQRIKETSRDISTDYESAVHAKGLN